MAEVVLLAVGVGALVSSGILIYKKFKGKKEKAQKENEENVSKKEPTNPIDNKKVKEKTNISSVKNGNNTSEIGKTGVNEQKDEVKEEEIVNPDSEKSDGTKKKSEVVEQEIDKIEENNTEKDEGKCIRDVPRLPSRVGRKKIIIAKEETQKQLKSEVYVCVETGKGENVEKTNNNVISTKIPPPMPTQKHPEKPKFVDKPEISSIRGSVANKFLQVIKKKSEKRVGKSNSVRRRGNGSVSKLKVFHEKKIEESKPIKLLFPNRYVEDGENIGDADVNVLIQNIFKFCPIWTMMKVIRVCKFFFECGRESLKNKKARIEETKYCLFFGEKMFMGEEPVLSIHDIRFFLKLNTIYLEDRIWSYIANHLQKSSFIKGTENSIRDLLDNIENCCSTEKIMYSKNEKGIFLFRKMLRILEYQRRNLTWFDHSSKIFLILTKYLSIEDIRMNENVLIKKAIESNNTKLFLHLLPFMENVHQNELLSSVVYWRKRNFLDLLMLNKKFDYSPEYLMKMLKECLKRNIWIETRTWKIQERLIQMIPNDYFRENQELLLNECLVDYKLREEDNIEDYVTLLVDFLNRCIDFNPVKTSAEKCCEIGNLFAFKTILNREKGKNKSFISDYSKLFQNCFYISCVKKFPKLVQFFLKENLVDPSFDNQKVILGIVSSENNTNKEVIEILMNDSRVNCCFENNTPIKNCFQNRNGIACILLLELSPVKSFIMTNFERFLVSSLRNYGLIKRNFPLNSTIQYECETWNEIAMLILKDVHQTDFSFNCFQKCINEIKCGDNVNVIFFEKLIEHISFKKKLFKLFDFGSMFVKLLPETPSLHERVIEIENFFKLALENKRVRMSPNSIEKIIEYFNYHWSCFKIDKNYSIFKDDCRGTPPFGLLDYKFESIIEQKKILWYRPNSVV